MTRRNLSYAIAMAAMVFLPGAGQAAVTPPSQKDLTLGTWELNLGKSKFACSQAPQASRRHIFDAGFGMMVAEWNATTADGKPFTTRYVWRYDGGKYPASIMRPDASEAIVYKLINPRRVEFVHLDKADKVTSTYYREVSADGQTMTQSTKYSDRTCEDLQVFERR
jgi:hypothetical protein